MRLTIIRDMGLVHVDGNGFDELDMSDVPADVHALQWYGSNGEIEYNDGKPNSEIAKLPAWVNLAKGKKDAKDAEIAAAEAQVEADRIARFNSAEGRKERAAARRYDEEVKGITLSNMEISTDRTSQALLTGAVTAAQLDPNLTAKWKIKNGHVTLDKTQLDTIAMAVRNHVQACFDREIEIIEAIDAGTFTDAMLDEGWPI